MDKKLWRREYIAALVSILFLALGILAVWLAKEFLELESDAVYVALPFIPIIIYLIFSGRISEFKAGGIEAKFRNVTEKPVEPALEPIGISIADADIFAKGGREELQAFKNYLRSQDISKPIILTLTLGGGIPYERINLLEYVEVLAEQPKYRFVIILNHEGKLEAYITPPAMLQLLQKEALGKEFVQAVREGKIQELRRYPDVITDTISTKSTNVEALKEMVNQNLEAIVVIDEGKKLKGIVKREQLLNKVVTGMVLGIAK